MFMMKHQCQNFTKIKEAIMKGFLTLIFLNILLLSHSFANGAGMNIDKKPSGTAGVDETYVDEINTKQSAYEKNETKTRQEMRENPRNPAMVESFGQVNSKEEKREKQQEKKANGRSPVSN
jgi:hypothetical protein